MADPLTLALSAIVFFVYGVTCLICVVFTLWPETYRKIDEMLKLDVISARVVNPLDIDIEWFDKLLMENNKTVGPLLILLSTIDLKLLFNLLYKS